MPSMGRLRRGGVSTSAFTGVQSSSQVRVGGLLPGFTVQVVSQTLPLGATVSTLTRPAWSLTEMPQAPSGKSSLSLRSYHVKSSGGAGVRLRMPTQA
ncbi:hypothetical protein ADK61_16730 [Streptomyces sp. XY66]|nr:hypothetical protein ADK61_16730 [Streptomyces sp. XY66]